MTDPDSLPTTADPTGRCPRCGRVSNFEYAGKLTTDVDAQNQPWESVTALRCMGCHRGTIVIEKRDPNGTMAPLHWWPPGDEDPVDPVVPAGVASFFDEGRRALSVHATRAAVVMFRAALAEVVTAVGSTRAQARSSLYDQLSQMEAEGAIHPQLLEWAKDVRLLGSVDARPNSLGQVGDEDAGELGRLVKQLIEVLFEVPARIARARAHRPTTAAGPVV